MEETLMKKYEEEKDSNRIRRVKEMSPDEQPREKAEKYGCECLSVAELWALILRVGSQGMPVTELCREMMERNGRSLHKLERRTTRELGEMKGMGPMKCIQVKAVMELIRRYCNEEIPQDESISSSIQIFQRMKNIIGNLDHEQIWALYLNRRNQVVKEMKLTTGSSIASIFDLKKVLKHALLENAESVILCHNHPSGNTRPSPQDDVITKELFNACKLMKLQMLDHIIVTANKYFSYRDEGKLG